MNQQFFFQLSLEEASRFIQDCVQQSLLHAQQQGIGPASTDNPRPQSDRLLNTKQVCQLLSITRVTCDTWRKAGKLPYERIAGRVYFYERRVLAALQSFERRGE